MEKVFGILLLCIFIAAVGVFTVIYFVSVNENIEKMLKRKGYGGYEYYRKAMDAKALRREKEQMRQLKERIRLPEKTNYTRKIAKRQQKRQVDSFYERNIDRRKR